MGIMSVREGQVLSMAASGHTDESIANELRISVATVRGYWLRIRAKLGGSSRAELVGKWIHVNSKSEGDRIAQEHRDQTQVHLEEFQKLLADERSAVDGVFNKATPAQQLLISNIREGSDQAMQRAHEANADTAASKR